MRLPLIFKPIDAITDSKTAVLSSVILWLALSGFIVMFLHDKTHSYSAKNFQDSVVVLQHWHSIPAIESTVAHLEIDKAKIAFQQAEQYQVYLVIFTGILIALSVYFSARWFRSRATIDALKKALSETNRNLEGKSNELKKVLNELNESEIKLIHKEKMSSLGQMVAEVAHEINTPLAYVKGNLEIVKGYLQELAELQELCRTAILVSSQEDANTNIQHHLGRLHELACRVNESNASQELADLIKDGIYGVEQISEIATNLKNFSSLNAGNAVSFDLNNEINSALTVTKNAIKDRADVSKRFGDIPNIVCSPSHVNQVISNLVINAAQSMKNKGTITISTSVHDQNFVRLEIEDNGQGMPPEVQEKIFEPFFTTKEAGKGTGLGLTIVHKIIDAYQGKISLASEVGMGTKFTILLPVNRVGKNHRVHSPIALKAA